MKNKNISSRIYVRSNNNYSQILEYDILKNKHSIIERPKTFDKDRMSTGFFVEEADHIVALIPTIKGPLIAVDNKLFFWMNTR